MHLLPGVLTLLLAAPAAASPITPLAGHWSGTAYTSADKCSWKVSGFMKEEKNGDGAGEFSDGTDEIDAYPHGMPEARAPTTCIRAVDLDRDGDPDLYVTNLGADEILLNR